MHSHIQHTLTRDLTLALEARFHFISQLIIALSVITPVNFLLCAGRLVNITGDVLLASGVVAYLGAFDARYRKAIIQGWQKLGKEQKIPCSNEFSLTNILGDQVTGSFINTVQKESLTRLAFDRDNSRNLDL